VELYKNSGDTTRKVGKLKTEGMKNCLSLPHIEALLKYTMGWSEA
jgi:hypothetical protein